MQNLAPANQMDPVTEAAILDGVYDAAYYATYYGGKAMPYIKKAAGAYAGYKAIKSEGKRLGKSLSRARKMARSYNPFTRRGRAGIGSLERRAGFRKAKRPPKRVARRGRPTASYGLAKFSRRFRKARKPIKDRGRYVARNYDDYGTMERDHSLWLGFQHHGSRDRLYDIVGEAITKAALAKIRTYPRSYDETIRSEDYSTMTMEFHRVTAAGVDEPVGVNVTIHNRTFKDIATDVGNEIMNAANGDTSVAPATDTVARYLHTIHLFNQADPSKARIILQDVGDSLISVKVKQKIRFQNITKNVDGNLGLDQAGLNPLRGRKYVFANYRPRLIDQIQRTHTQYDDFMVSDPVLVGPVDSAPGIMPMPATGSLAKDDPICHPPAARQLFTNCKASAAITMAAGAMKHESTTFTMTHKLKHLIERIYFAGFDKGAFGACTWIGLEKAYRQAQPSGVSNDDRISIGFNREVHMYAKCKFITQKSMLKHYDASDVGLIAAA